MGCSLAAGSQSAPSCHLPVSFCQTPSRRLFCWGDTQSRPSSQELFLTQCRVPGEQAAGRKGCVCPPTMERLRRVRRPQESRLEAHSCASPCLHSLRPGVGGPELTELSAPNSLQGTQQQRESPAPASKEVLFLDQGPQGHMLTLHMTSRAQPNLKK